MMGRIQTRARVSGAGLVLAVAALSVGFTMPASLTAVAAPPPPDTVVKWNEYAVNALIVTALQPPTVSALHLAMVHGAVYDAVNAIDGGYEPYLVSPKAKKSYSKDAAAATAAFKVLVNIVPTQAAALQPLYDSTLAAIHDGPAKTGGIRVGERAAAAMIKARADDGRYGPPGFPVGTEPGEWRPTPTLFLNDPAAWVADVEPFLLKSTSQFRSKEPAELTSARYTRDFNEVKSIGSAASTTRTSEQTDIAKFWADHGIALWSRMFRQISDTEDLSVVENARLLAMLYLTSADAVINCWNDKGYYGSWRPVTAIREATSDGNPKTAPDTGWLPLIETPPFPEYPAGHGCATSSIVRTLQRFFGTDQMDFGTESAYSKTTRTFTSFSEALEEVIDARVYSGIHFRTADERGAVLGRKVANYARQHFFEPDD